MPPVPPLIQDYRPYYHTPNDLSELSFFSFLQGDNHQHYNMVMAAAAAASASDDHELLLNRFLPYTTSSSGPSHMYLSQSAASVPSLTTPTNGVRNSSSSSSSSSSGTHSSTHSHNSHLRDPHPNSASSHIAHHPGVLASRASSEAAMAAIYGGIPDIISLD